MRSNRLKMTGRAWSRRGGPPGMNLIVLGLACFVIGFAFDGFVRGFFIGATVALMVMGAYVIGASRERGRSSGSELDDAGHWLPSRDNGSDRADR